MAAARYDWRIPEEDEAETELEVPAPLREALARATKKAQTSAESSSRPNAEGRPWLPAPSVGAAANAAASSGGGAAGDLQSQQQPTAGATETKEGSGEAIPTMPTEQLLFKMVETFLAQDFLPKARRSILTGSLLSKERSQLEKTTPNGVWRL